MGNQSAKAIGKKMSALQPALYWWLVNKAERHINRQVKRQDDGLLISIKSVRIADIEVTR